jgi:hypothetical protein
MKIVRAQNIVVADILKPFFLDGMDFGREDYAELLKNQMTEFPDETCVLIAFDGDEVIGFLIAWIPISQKHVFIHQTWIQNKDVYKNVGKTFLDILINFCQNLNIEEIRAETTREPNSFLRKYGFKPFSIIISLDVKEYDHEIIHSRS